MEVELQKRKRLRCNGSEWIDRWMGNKTTIIPIKMEDPLLLVWLTVSPPYSQSLRLLQSAPEAAKN